MRRSETGRLPAGDQATAPGRQRCWERPQLRRPPGEQFRSRVRGRRHLAEEDVAGVMVLKGVQELLEVTALSGRVEEQLPAQLQEDRIVAETEEGGGVESENFFECHGCPSSRYF